MFTSDTDHKLRQCAAAAFVYLLIACFCALFGWIYEHFSHGVYSYAMLYAFAYPLLGGTLPLLALGLSRRGSRPIGMDVTLYRCGIATLTLGSIITGVLEIYGTRNPLTDVYQWVGWVLVGIGLLARVLHSLFAKKPQ